ncbi:MAG: hypothetical protein WAN74_04505 [Thermoplasmata archaeon]
MHKVWIGIGLLILIAGLIVGVLGNVQTNVATLSSTQRTSSHTATEFLLGTGSVSVTWSQAPANTTFALLACSDSSCSSGRTVATGNGSSGTFSSGASNAQTFQIQITGPFLLGSNASATIAWTESGFTYVALGGLALSVGGVALVYLAIERSVKSDVVANAKTET